MNTAQAQRPRQEIIDSRLRDIDALLALARYDLPPETKPISTMTTTLGGSVIESRSGLIAKIQRTLPHPLKLRIDMWPEDAYEMRLELECSALDCRYQELLARKGL